MMRLASLGGLVLAVIAGACGGGNGDSAVRYDVTVNFNTSVKQEDLDAVESVLRSYDQALEFLILESFPPIGRASLATDESGFCRSIEAELEAESYVREVLCEEHEEPPPSSSPDEPVTSG